MRVNIGCNGGVYKLDVIPNKQETTVDKISSNNHNLETRNLLRGLGLILQHKRTSGVSSHDRRINMPENETFGNSFIIVANTAH